MLRFVPGRLFRRSVLAVATASILAGAPALAAEPDKPTVRPARNEFTGSLEGLELSGIGTCLVKGGSPVDLEQMLTMTNRSVDVTQGGVTRRVRLGLQVATIETDRGTPRSVIQAYNIGADVQKPGEGIDIELSLVMIDGVLAVYWRETYQHQLYRQGLYRVDRDRLTPWCEGEGGISTTEM